ncbi:MAG: hypothetical protein NC405_02250 [Odoribacter sp.]|nr:hypothetical protein [Odoribacter sp.]
MRKAFLIIALLGMIISSCSDSKLEKELDGTWISTTHENEDGVTCTFEETLELDSKTNKMINSAVMMIGGMRFCSISIDGTWSARGDEIFIDFDKKSADVNADTDLLSLAGMSEDDILESLLDEVESGVFEIIKLDGDRLIVKDGDGNRTNYTRK